LGASPLYQRIYDLVCQVPSGRVTTYGKIARMVGCTPRLVGFSMASVKPELGVPWQRVINSQGLISLKGSSGDLQRQLLLDEGIEFNARGRIDLSEFGWPD
jgi:methylated-DNA-protein-cysteine methyltransferase related protein